MFLVYSSQTFMPISLAFSYAKERGENVGVYFVNPRRFMHPVAYLKKVFSVEIAIPVNKPIMAQVEESMRYKFVVLNPTLDLPISPEDSVFMSRKKITIAGPHVIEEIPWSNLLIINKVPNFVYDEVRRMAERLLSVRAEGIVIVPMCRKLFQIGARPVWSPVLAQLLIALEEEKLLHYGSVIELKCSDFEEPSSAV